MTTYLRRLLHRDSEKIELLIDFYSGKKEPVRKDCQDKVIQVGGAIGLLAWLCFNRRQQKNKELLFNFSTSRALVLTLLVPKIKSSKWILMLHHGDLAIQNPFFHLIARVALRRFDQIQSLSLHQAKFYRSLGVSDKKIVSSSSYCEPVDHQDHPVALRELYDIRKKYNGIVVMSGFPSALYNLNLGIELISSISSGDGALCIFIYGPGELRDFLIEKAKCYSWLYVFDGFTEQFFNTFLRHSNLLMRLTATDSFGISVWDADYWRIPIVASSVCERPLNAHVFDLDKFNIKEVCCVVDGIIN